MLDETTFTLLGGPLSAGLGRASVGASSARHGPRPAGQPEGLDGGARG